MSNDNKTLAEVQPGGRVRLGDALLPCPFCGKSLTINGAGDGVHPRDSDCILAQHVVVADHAPHAAAWNRRALSAQPSPDATALGLPIVVDPTVPPDTFEVRQPSPGGQDALKALVARWRAEAAAHELNGLEADSIGLTVAAMRNDARHHVLEAATDELEAALAARQPVEFERAIPTRRRESAVELLLQLGFVWNNQRWEDRRQPVGQEPVAWVSPGQLEEFRNGTSSFGSRIPVRIEKGGLFDMPLYAAPPAQAVDLAENMLSVLIEEGVLARNGRVFQKLRALIDSQAVGK